MSEMPHSDPERDARLAALYRAGGRDEPPPALDDAIRAVARRAVSSGPRPAGSPSSRAWQVPTSIAAVIVLAASLVILMRDEAPELAAPPSANAPPPAATVRNSGEPARDVASTVPKVALLPEAHEPGGIGLKPPQAAATTGLAVRRDEPAVASSGELRQEKTAADRAVSAAAPVQREPSAFPDSVESRGTDAAAPGASGVRATAAADQSSGDRAGRAQERTRGPAAQIAAKPVQQRATPSSASEAGGESLNRTDLPAEKWLERIDELRRQGRYEDAASSLAEFKKRYPDYVLPPHLREGIKP